MNSRSLLKHVLAHHETYKVFGSMKTPRYQHISRGVFEPCYGRRLGRGTVARFGQPLYFSLVEYLNHCVNHYINHRINLYINHCINYCFNHCDRGLLPKMFGCDVCTLRMTSIRHLVHSSRITICLHFSHPG